MKIDVNVNKYVDDYDMKDEIFVGASEEGDEAEQVGGADQGATGALGQPSRAGVCKFYHDEDNMMEEQQTLSANLKKEVRQMPVKLSLGNSRKLFDVQKM